MLLDHLGVRSLRLAIGGDRCISAELGASYPFVRELVLVAGCRRRTDWAIGIGEERFAMADGKWAGGDYDPNDPPKAGLAAAARGCELTYRAPVGGRSTRPRDHLVGHRSTRVETDAARRSRRDGAQHVGDGRAAALRGGELSAYQGRKLLADSTPIITQLTCTLDSHDVSRGRGEYEDVMRGVKQRALVVGITSDVLYPFHLREEMVRLMRGVHVRDRLAARPRASRRDQSLNDAVAFPAGPDSNRRRHYHGTRTNRLPPPPRYGVVDGGFVAAVVAAVVTVGC